MGFLFTKLSRFLLVIFLFYTVTTYYLRTKSYNISPKLFKSIAAKATDSKFVNAKTSVETVTSGFKSSYSSLLPSSLEWNGVHLGNHNLQILPLHLGFTEFAVILGSPFGSIGRIGFQWSNSTCTVISGSITRQKDSHVLEDNQTFKVGNNFRHGEFESYIYNFQPDTYVACYGRGFVPLSGVWVAISGLNSGEPLSVGKLYLNFLQTVYNRSVLSFFDIFNHYKDKASGKIKNNGDL